MLNELPKVSILIPVFNRVNLIQDCLNSVLCQSYSNLEIIISDNCSTDGTIDILRMYEKIDSRIRVILNSCNRGPVYNWFSCLNAASGKYSMFLWSDDLLEAGVVSRCLEKIESDVSFVISKYAVFNSDGLVYESKFQKRNIYNTEFLLNELLVFQVTDFPFSPAGTLFRTDDLKKYMLFKIPNPFNLKFEEFGAGNDLLLFILILSKYAKVICINETGVYFRNHSGSITVANNLFKFYEYSRLYYILNFRPDLSVFIKSKYFVKSIFSKNYREFLSIHEGHVSVLYTFIYLLKYFYRKIRYIYE